MKIKSHLNIFRELERLNFPKDQFIVVGSGIMAAKGIRPSYDLDIVVSPELFERCENEDWELRPWTRTGSVGKPWLEKGTSDLMLEIHYNGEGLDIHDLKRDGEQIHGYWFISLPQLIRFKKVYGRPKDFEDIALIEKYLDENMI